MIQNTALIRALRELGFTFKEQTDRMMVYKRRGSSIRVLVRRHAAHDPEYCAILLKQAGMSPDDIAAFIRSCDI